MKTVEMEVDAWCIHTEDEAGHVREFRFQMLQVAPADKDKWATGTHQEAHKRAGLNMAFREHRAWAARTGALTGKIRFHSVHAATMVVREHAGPVEGSGREGIWNVSFAGQ